MTIYDELEFASQNYGFSKLDRLRSSNRTDFDSIPEHRLIGINTNNKEYWRFLSLFFLRKRNFKNAIKSIEKHIQTSNSNEAKARLNRAFFLLELEEGSSNYKESYLKWIGKDLPEEIRQELDEKGSLVNCFFNSYENSDEFHYGNQKFLEENKERFNDLLAKINKFNSFAIVGNGPSVLNSKKGSEIDEHDFVTRVNFPNVEAFIEFVGSKTDLILTSNQHFKSDKVRKGILDAMRRYNMGLTLVVDAAQINRTEQPEGVDLNVYRNIVSLPASVRCILSQLTYPFATTGLSGIVTLSLLLSKKLDAYGFDFYSLEQGYYFSRNGFEPTLLHEIEYELIIASKVIPSFMGNRFRIL